MDSGRDSNKSTIPCSSYATRRCRLHSAVVYFEELDGTIHIYQDGTIIHTGITASSQNVLSFTATGGGTFDIVQTGITPIDKIAPSTPVNLTATAVSDTQKRNHFTIT